MSAPDFIQLAMDTLGDAILAAGVLTEAHAGILSADEDEGALDAAFDAVINRDLMAALGHLNTSIALAAVPPLAPTEGRSRAHRHRVAKQERKRIGTVAQVVRVLVLQAVLNTP